MSEESSSPSKPVALKVLGTSLGMTSKAVVRFRREAEAAANGRGKAEQWIKEGKYAVK